ncbi:MAG: hypothetical protein ABSC77_03545 [Terracidiphilus sp.]|jgi:hypothetical protein
MKTRIFAALLFLCAATLAAQTPATPDNALVPIPPPPSPSDTLTHSSDLGFSYSIPADWEVVETTKPMLPEAAQQVARNFGNEAAKMAACLQLPLTAHHGNPPSTIAVAGLFFDCVGHTYTTQDLPSVASDVSDNLKNNLQIANPVSSTYTLGTHSVWIQRVSGSLIGHPEINRTMETVCSTLKKGVVCWMILATDNDALQTFENGMVTLDDDAATALVPANTLQTKP